MNKVEISNKDDIEMNKLSAKSLSIDPKWSPVVRLSRIVVDNYLQQQRTPPKMKTSIADIFGKSSFILALENQQLCDHLHWIGKKKENETHIQLLFRISMRGINSWQCFTQQK